jgi:hypothetical protein
MGPKQSSLVQEISTSNPKYDELVVETDFAHSQQHNYSGIHEPCEFFLSIFPSAEMESDYMSNKPLIYTLLVILIFLFMAVVFVLYDYFVGL